MTAETIHTCSYSCERPECIRAQRDELAARLTDSLSQPAGDAEVWLFKGTDGEWRTFHNEQHRLDTIADGRWEVRKFYALSQQPEAQAQDGGEVYMEVTVRDGAWVGTYAEWRRRNRVAPPSAPVGVGAIAAEIRASLGRGATVCTRRRWAIELEALAQQQGGAE